MTDRDARRWLVAVLVLSLGLNLWSIGFGLPVSWHPDELNGRAVHMLREVSLNPHSFLYGSLHYYLISGVMVPAYLAAKLLSLPEPAQKAAAWLAARALSAILGVGCVALLFVITRALFNRSAGLLAALFLTLTVGFVNMAHFGTVDVPMLFWMLASYAMAASVLNGDVRRAYVLAGLFAGLAAATKYVGGIALLGLVVAHVLSPPPRRHMDLLLGGLCAALAFIVANPPMIFASCEFFEGFVMDNAFNTVVRADIKAAPWRNTVLAVYQALGLPFSALAMAALLYGAGLLLHREHRAQVFFILTMLVPFVVLISNLHYASSRHILPTLPPLLILMGKMIADLVRARTASLRLLGAATAVLTISASAVRTIAAELEFTFDARYAASAWVQENMPEGAKIEVTAYSPWLPEDRFEILTRPWQRRNLAGTIAAVEASTVYRMLHPVYAHYKRVAERVGVCPPRDRHYEGWYERVQADLAEDLQTFDTSIEGLEARNPEVLIVSDFYYGRFEYDHTSPEALFFKSLLAGRSDYQQVEQFHYQSHPWLDPDLEFINPTIRIFRRSPESGMVGDPLEAPRS